MSVYTNDIDTLRQMISQSMPQLLNSGITIVSVFISMLILSIPLTIVTMVMVGIMVFCSKKSAGQSGAYFAKQQKDLGTVNGYIEEMMNGQKVVKVFCHEEENMQNFKKLNDELYISADRANTFANFLGPINAQIGNISYVICAIVGGVLALGKVGGFTLGGLASFLTFNKSFSMPINQISMQMNAIVMAMAGADRIFRLMDEKEELDEGYVTLVNAKEEDGNLTECEERTERWHGNIDIRMMAVWIMWKSKVKLYSMAWISAIMMRKLYCMISNCMRNRDRRLLSSARPVQVRRRLPI